MVKGANQSDLDSLLQNVLINNEDAVISILNKSEFSALIRSGSTHYGSGVSTGDFVNLDIRDETGKTPLMHACQLGNIRIVSALLERGAKVNLKDDSGETPLMKAAKVKPRLGSPDFGRGEPETAAPPPDDEEGSIPKTPPPDFGVVDERITEDPHCQVIKLLWDFVIYSNKILQEDSWSNELREAYVGHEVHNLSFEASSTAPSKEMCTRQRKLLEAKDAIGQTALLKACESGNVPIFQTLVSLGAKIDNKDDEGWDILMWATTSGSLSLVKYIYYEFACAKVGAPPDAPPPPLPIIMEYYTDGCGENALMKAAGRGHVSICNFLAKHGAKINSPDRDGQTAIMWAAATGNTDVVQTLVDLEARLDLQSSSGKTCLMIACLFGNVEVAELLASRMPRVDVKDVNGQNALHLAATADVVPAIGARLIEKKCAVDGMDKANKTPLMIAAERGNLNSVRSLVEEFRAKTDVTDEDGKTALDYAESTLSARVVEYLRSRTEE